MKCALTRQAALLVWLLISNIFTHFYKHGTVVYSFTKYLIKYLKCGVELPSSNINILTIFPEDYGNSVVMSLISRIIKMQLEWLEFDLNPSQTLYPRTQNSSWHIVGSE